MLECISVLYAARVCAACVRVRVCVCGVVGWYVLRGVVVGSLGHAHERRG